MVSIHFSNSGPVGKLPHLSRDGTAAAVYRDLVNVDLAVNQTPVVKYGDAVLDAVVILHVVFDAFVVQGQIHAFRIGAAVGAA
jgi:hypothetical protein